ncbi:efflux RND transporter permease subunit [bacterium SCSIO 12696]|nr:efflux RND transporter permease subunit [bacterium SCSIO 12696]
MSITEFSIKNRVVTWLAVALLVFGGVMSYENLGKLEDPEFTIKTAVVATQYPGAGPVQVEKEVTERIEIALQEIAEIDYVESVSRAGLSLVKVEIKSKYWSDKLPQIWDTLRRKIRNIERDLPIGASRPEISDDFGDVFGFVLAVTGDGYSYKELEKEVKNLKRKLSLVEDVSRVEFWGKQNRAVYLKVSESRLAEMGIKAGDIAQALNLQNNILPSGNVYYDEQAARIQITGEFNSIEDIAHLSISPSQLSEFVSGETQDQLITIRDIAEVEEGFIEPSVQTMRYNGQPAIGLAISNVAGSNIIELGERLEKRLDQLQAEIPVGIDVHKISWQADEVGTAIDSFIVSLIEAVVIVLVVLALAMGWRMGVIIGTSLVLTILGTLIFMNVMGIDLQRMSLGALVIALGMMVDNSIVVGDGIMVRLRQGKSRMQAAVESARGPSMPLLGATVIAVLAFYPIGGSTEDVGEYCLSLFQVVGISLMFSWLVSMTVTPMQCVAMLKTESGDHGERDPYSSPFFRGYRHVLEKAIKFRGLTLILMVGLLVVSGWGFKYVPKSFFPDSSRPQFMVDMYAPTGTRIPQTAELLARAEAKIMSFDGVDSVSSFIGSGPPRFYLPVEPELFFQSYGQLIVNVDDYKKIDGIIETLQPWLKENVPEAPVFRVRKYSVGPGNAWKFELRVSAPDDAGLDEIRAIGNRGLDLIKDHSLVADARLDWREKAPKVVVDYDQNEGRWAQITRGDVAGATRRAFDGLPVGQFREGDDLLPILLRNEAAERDNASSIYTVQIPQAFSGETVPLTQVADDVTLDWEDPLIWRRDRQRTITIQAEPLAGVTLPTLRNDVLATYAEFERSLPPGYTVEWGAEAESSEKSQSSLIPGLIPAVVLMFFIIVLLFNELKPAIIIFLTIPLSLIGIAAGLLGINVSFGFMSLLGALSLAGMMIKNAIVLIDEIKLNINEKGQKEYDAIINAGLSRLNPVAMAAATTVLGVIPLIQDVFWVSMAVTIMAGLAFGTVLTMIVVPVLYALFYKVKAH